jgi:mono/diheme cytochrome c family protein
MRGVSGLLVCVALVWGVVTASNVLAQTAAPVKGPEAVPAEAKKMKAAFPSSPAAIEAGKVLFAKYCRFCHGNTGAGDSTMAPKTMKPSNLTDTEWTRGSSDGELFWIIQNGAPPKYDMKPLKGKVTDADTWNLVHFVRSLGGAGK